MSTLRRLGGIWLISFGLALAFGGSTILVNAVGVTMVVIGSILLTPQEGDVDAYRERNHDRQ